ncbi:putative transcriptional regulatory protein [Candidatus Arcanobacter lacustris]|uniref:Probable transcriptional regulatory protein SZ25_00770 n=1 Tax=Candidatus Arcanibacter lacustris TaxID=1607817 RepID=A0A0F5MMX2_9RICK|nr:putative transcriptional regulatory protein [Candidatus Arcanobacter lacustris]
MAGHSQFKNIMHRKNAQDSKRAKLFTKLVREIISSVRAGQADPNFNPRLRAAISAARANNLPKDRIDNAIKKGSTVGEGDNYEEIRYEAYAPGGVAFIVEALTDNRNRTASDVRSTFTKRGGALGETGSVNFMFERIGLIEYPASVSSEDEMFETALEAGADSCESDEFSHVIHCNPDSFNEVRDVLTKKFGDAQVSRLSWLAKDHIEIDDIERAESLMKLIDTLEDSDDVQFVCGNYQFSDEVLKKLEG